jgi:predicted O-methyltransferase YrrM
MWLGLSAAPSVLLLATTQQICQEVSVVPFLWILPLGIYLLSFILCFDSERWYRRPIFAALMPLSCLGAGYALLQLWEISFAAQIAIFATALFCCCMACHGELVRSRPPVQRLTLFYLCVSAGGALGGLFCAAVATQIFTKYWELHVGLAACVFLALVSYHRSPTSELAGGRPRWAWVGLVVASLGLGAVLVVDASSEFELDAEVVERSRNFYGVLTVYRMEDEIGSFYALDHGRIRHGIQYLDPVRRRQPSSYYHPETGVGLAMRLHPSRRARSGRNSLRIGVVGLGAGSLAVYGDEGDALRFYEINPEVIRLARERFTYLEDTRSDVTLVLGDARAEMERELAEGENQNFDVLVIDAFSSDAVPMHLMTREGFELYWEHLKPDGILVIQVTNVYLDLTALVRGTARLLGYEALWVEWSPRGMAGYEPNTWILVTRNRDLLENPIVRRRVTPWSRDPKPDIVWTDDYGALFQVLRD